MKVPAVGLPKGGGAVRGMGEKFAANPVRGTGSLTIPLPVSPGRSGFGPQLTLSYDSGAPHGAFGLGWSLGLPVITRKTDKGLPQYDDGLGFDVFLLSGTEDLVPFLDGEGRPQTQPRTVDGIHYEVLRYRPRIEGLYARIERWTATGSGEVHWRSLSRENVTTLYGRDANSRIADPADPVHRVFSWLICESFDDKGNAIVYEYAEENDVGVDLTAAHERHRPAACRTTNRYLKAVRYGNKDSRLAEPPPERDLENGWHFELVFDYGDHAPLPPPAEGLPAGEAAPPGHDWPTAAPTPGRDWYCRHDAFSGYRSGFEVRSYRLCQNILMFHHFPDEPDVGDNCLVRSMSLSYRDNRGEPQDRQRGHPAGAVLAAVTVSGHRRAGEGYLSRSLPPLELTYSTAAPDPVVRELDATSLENLPVGVNGNYQWADLDGEAISGVLTRQAGAWWYKPNDGEGRFGPLQRSPVSPSPNEKEGQQLLLDLAGDGRLDLVDFAGPTPGFFERSDDGGWSTHQAFSQLPRLDWSDPDLRFVDVTGDGRTDVLVAQHDAFTWYPSLGEAGFGAGRRTAVGADEASGPRLVFTDGTGSVHLADLSGDGLADLVRIRNGEVCYWPNLGHGRFGPKVVMDHAPCFDRADRFDQARVRLADLDGTGPTDLVYLGADGVDLYTNEMGNSWSDPVRLPVFPPVDNLANVMVADVLGKGTACLVWSSPLAAAAGRQLRYVDLMGSKPHLLTGVSNNLGAETVITYSTSTLQYLRDKAAGQLWMTRLPFPVHVVAKVETLDWVNRNKFVTRYAYHHGHFDGEEREFRGFGLVEMWDTEESTPSTVDGSAPLTAHDDAACLPLAAHNDRASRVPPVHTKTWFHTGLHLGRAHVSDYFAGLRTPSDGGEYFREPGLSAPEVRSLLLPDSSLPPGLSPDEEREACRALKGSMLRQEVYAEDAGDIGGAGDTGADVARARRSGVPYTVIEQNFGVRTVRRRGAGQHGVFLVHPCEVLAYHYERDPADPRVRHRLTLEVDDYGNVLKEAEVGYGRRPEVRVVSDSGQVRLVPNPGLAKLGAADRARQTTPLLTYTENRVTRQVDTADAYRTPVPCETLTFELTGYPATGQGGRYRAADLVERAPGGTSALRHRFTDEVAYEASPTGNRCRRPIAQTRILYRSDDLTALLPLGQLQALGLPGESYALALTPGLLSDVFQRPHDAGPAEALLRDPAAVLGGRSGRRGGYVLSKTLKDDGLFPAADPDGLWWAPSGRSFFTTDPNDDTAIELGRARHDFFLTRRTRDPFGQNATVDYDAHRLLATETRDALGNRVTADINDYRVLQPRLISDPNRNRTEVAFDALGLVAGTAVRGKAPPAPPEGDTLTGFAADLTQAQLDDWFQSADPHAGAADLICGATTRVLHDLHRFRRTRRAHPTNPSRWQPAAVAMLARETHVHAPLPPHGLRIQLAFTYCDGFGRAVQKKLRAEPEKVNGAPGPPRWVASGWTVFNNKGKPVRTYEPFFSQKRRTDGRFVSDHLFEYGVTAGVSPVLFYDPPGRVVATLLPDHTYEKTVFGPWQQTTYDVNDTCAPRNDQTGDPRTDPDVSGLVAGHFASLPGSGLPSSWQTWRALRIDGGLGPYEQSAARRAEAHADTPTSVHLDVLGRPFLTVTRNRVACVGHPLDGTEDTVLTRVDLDIAGRQTAVSDERPATVDHLPTGAPERRTVLRSTYDLRGTLLRQQSMEAGTRWTLGDAAGYPLRGWDSRGHSTAMVYDELRRPVQLTVRGTTTTGDTAPDPRTLGRDVVVERIEYGEPPTTAGQAEQERALNCNLRTRILRHFDSAGVTVHARLESAGIPVEAYDFKGNPLRTTRRFARDHTALPDWSLNPPLQPEAFEGGNRYDALDRVVQSVAPHSDRPGTTFHVMQPLFNEANLLERTDVWLETAAEPTALIDPATTPPTDVGVADAAYNAKGQRLYVAYKNGAETRYRYDPETFRLSHLYTRRGSAFTEDCDNALPPPDTRAAPETPPPDRACGLQNLRYTYDPAGNVVHVRDDAQQTLFFRNQRVEPSSDFTYDARYRLLEANGREHLGQQANGDRWPPTAPDAFNAFHTGHEHPNTAKAMGTYRESYVYDGAGNLLQMLHRGTDPAHPGWTRNHLHAEPSLLDGPGGAPATSNRLTSTTLNPHGSAPQTQTYAHDPHGSMVRLPHLGDGTAAHNAHWDHADRLCRVDLGGGGTAFYVYDAAGRRVRKVWEKAPGDVEERLYVGDFEVFRRHDGAIGPDTAVRERETVHVQDDRQRIALVEIRTRDKAGTDRAPRRTIRFQLGNHLGSSSLELDEQSQIISYEEYAPYGSTVYQAVRSRLETPKRYRFTGKERDEESGLYDHGARYYAAFLGMWCSADQVPGINRYAYCNSNPIGSCDPDGHRPVNAIEPTDAGPAQNAADTSDSNPARTMFCPPEAVDVMDMDGAPAMSPLGAYARVREEWHQTEVDPEGHRHFWIDRHDVTGPPPDHVDPGCPVKDPGPGGSDVSDPVPDLVDPGEPVGDTGGDVRDPAIDKTLPPPPAKNPKLIFPEVTIWGKLKSESAPVFVPRPASPPPTYVANNIQFEGSTDWEGKGPAKFAGKGYMAEIDNVAALLKGDVQVRVTIEAYVGSSSKFMSWLKREPLGRGEKVYQAFGGLMDARARAVRDELVKRGISTDRIRLARGAAEDTPAGRRVEFHFTRE
ncbi:SpvB/TcaC N-terminal domain-containing protein [Streptomyces chartreusis]